MKAILRGLVAVAMATGGAVSAESMRVQDLRCEYKENPQGIEVIVPRLTWVLGSDAYGQRQSAYQILVADSEAALKQSMGTLWDSGKVESSATSLIQYGGKPLNSRMACFWKVRSWNQDGEASAWSDTAFWSMGLLQPKEWTAQWIGYDAAEPQPWLEEQYLPPSMEGAAWIWNPDGQTDTNAPVGKAYFRHTFEVPEGPVQDAFVALTADDKARVFLNGVDLSSGRTAISSFKKIYRVPLRDQIVGGRNVLAIEAENGGKEPNPAGLVAKVYVKPVDGAPLAFSTDGAWKSAREVAGDTWRNLDFDDKNWKPAVVVAPVGQGAWPAPAVEPELILPPPPVLRKEFAAKPAVRRATVYATALGIYELQLNGKRVGDRYFTPGWTDYDKRLYYNTFDVTELVEAGKPNALAATLADGWYSGYMSFRLLTGLDRVRDYYGSQPRLRVQLELEYEDGTLETVATDETWKATYGPIRESDLLMGETHDARVDLGAWTEAGYDDSSWKAVSTGYEGKALLQAHPGEPVKQFEQLEAKSRTEPEPGRYVYDLGQNMVGWARIKVKGESGDVVTVRHAEILNPDGTVYTQSLRMARAIDRYVLKGDGPETLEPKFTFHGFQYVEISGIEKPPAAEDVVGVVMHTPIPQTGTFECSEPLLNQLFHNIVWGQKGNYFEIPTDCPQRDERLGWTGDAQFFMPTAAYTADVGAFFTKWLVDLVKDAQAEDGSWGDVAPNVGLGSGAVAWGDAAIICTYNMYQYYGDTRIIEKHFDHLQKGMQFYEKTSEGFIRKKMGYGDWLNLGGGAKDEVICTAYFYYLAQLMREMSAAIDNQEAELQYAALGGKIKEAFINAFVKEDGSILESSQTGYALAFTMGLIPEPLLEKAAAKFEQEIVKHDNHLATGFIGTPRLLPALSNAGKFDKAYELLLTKTYPSWLFQVTLGATTMWERWDGWTPDKGFQTNDMNSFNHYAFGSVGEFLYREVGGIQSDGPAFKKLILRPRPGGGLTWAKTSYRSIHGPISTNWRIEDGRMKLEVTVPANVTATVYVPGSQVMAKSGSAHAREAGTVDGAVMYEVGSGEYSFESTL